MARKPGYKNPNAGRRKIPLIIEIPPKEIILDNVFYWINLQATQEEVAGSFRVSVETLNARLMEHFGMNFTELRKRTDGEGKLSLRRYQFKQAEKNATMAIFLGKNWLGQTDGREEKAPPNDVAITQMLTLIKENGEHKQRIQDLEARLAKKFGIADMNA